MLKGNVNLFADFKSAKQILEKKPNSKPVVKPEDEYKAYIQIRDSGIYLQYADTFEEFCEKVLGKSVRSVQKLIRTYRVELKKASATEVIPHAIASLDALETPIDLPEEDPIPSVYFIQCDNGPVKIGISREVDVRLKALDMSNPYPVKLLGIIQNAGLAKEFELHEMFESTRVKGEWFSPSPELLSLISAECQKVTEIQTEPIPEKVAFIDKITKSKAIMKAKDVRPPIKSLQQIVDEQVPNQLPPMPEIMPTSESSWEFSQILNEVTELMVKHQADLDLIRAIKNVVIKTVEDYGY